MNKKVKKVLVVGLCSLSSIFLLGATRPARGTVWEQIKSNLNTNAEEPSEDTEEWISMQGAIPKSCGDIVLQIWWQGNDPKQVYCNARENGEDVASCPIENTTDLYDSSLYRFGRNKENNEFICCAFSWNEDIPGACVHVVDDCLE